MISQTSIAIVAKAIAIGAVKKGRVSLSLRLGLGLTLSIVVSIAKMSKTSVSVMTKSSISIMTKASIAMISQTSIPIVTKTIAIGAVEKGWVSLSIGLRFSFSITLSIIVTIAKPMQTISVSIMSEPSISVS